MTQYNIKVVGCDDSTAIVKHLDEDEAALIKAIAEEITSESSYGCMPIMRVWKVGENEPIQGHSHED